MINKDGLKYQVAENEDKFELHRSASDERSVKLLSNPCFSDQSVKAVREASELFIKKHGLVAFELARVCDNGTAILLYSDSSIPKYLISKRVVITAPIAQPVSQRELWYLPSDDSKYVQLLRDLKESSSTEAQGFANFIQRHSGYYDMFCFMSKNDQNSLSNQLINSKESFESFCFEFRSRIQPLLSSLSQNPLEVPNEMLSNVRGLTKTELNQPCDQIVFRPGSLRYRLEMYLSQNEGISLTQREIDCIVLISEGKTAKDMAEVLGISFRTVENHISSLRGKFSCNRKSELLGRLEAVLKGEKKRESGAA